MWLWLCSSGAAAPVPSSPLSEAPGQCCFLHPAMKGKTKGLLLETEGALSRSPCGLVGFGLQKQLHNPNAVVDGCQVQRGHASERERGRGRSQRDPLARRSCRERNKRKRAAAADAGRPGHADGLWHPDRLSSGAKGRCGGEKKLFTWTSVSVREGFLRAGRIQRRGSARRRAPNCAL